MGEESRETRVRWKGKPKENILRSFDFPFAKENNVKTENLRRVSAVQQQLSIEKKVHKKRGVFTKIIGVWGKRVDLNLKRMVLFNIDQWNNALLHYTT